MMKSFLCELLNKEISLVESIFQQKLTEKQLKIDICIIRDMLNESEIYSTEWCKSESQLADCLTKGTASNTKSLKVLKNGNGLLE